MTGSGPGAVRAAPSERASGLTRAEVWCVNTSTLLVGGTGIVYALMRYLLRPEDPFAVVNHPWQPAVQHLHVVTAPVLVFAAGLLWRAHVRPALRYRVTTRRRSGWMGLLTLSPMVASGYLLQISVGTGWRTAWTVVHVAASVVWLLAYALHRAGARAAQDRPRV